MVGLGCSAGGSLLLSRRRSQDAALSYRDSGGHLVGLSAQNMPWRSPVASGATIQPPPSNRHLLPAPHLAPPARPHACLTSRSSTHAPAQRHPPGPRATSMESPDVPEALTPSLDTPCRWTEAWQRVASHLPPHGRGAGPHLPQDHPPDPTVAKHHGVHSGPGLLLPAGGCDGLHC